MTRIYIRSRGASYVTVLPRYVRISDWDLDVPSRSTPRVGFRTHLPSRLPRAGA